MSERVLICGDRAWTDVEKIRGDLQALKLEARGEIVVGHGDCRGADTCGGYAARLLGISVKAYPADWKRHGRAAGPIRNRLMLKEFRPTMVLAYHDNLAASKGTKDMVTIARAAGIPTFVHTHGAVTLPQPTNPT